MSSNRSGRSDRLSRRELLAAAGVGAGVAGSGCIESVQSVVPGSGNQLSLSISAVPDDDDRQSNGIFRTLERNLEAVGIDVTIDLRTTHEFLRSVLLDHEFDIYVGAYTGSTDPDVLYGLLHSKFENEPGWQNPFGYTNLTLDERLEDQRQLDGESREGAVEDVVETLVAEKPFVPICRPDEYRLVRGDRFDGWEDDHLSGRLGYLGLDPQESADRLTGIVTDARPTQNLNPLAVHYRDRGAIIDLIYDSLATRREEDVIPWLATDWEWDERDLYVTVRSDSRFHDDEPLGIEDVHFTYELLRDGSLGRAETPIPPIRFRRAVSAITETEIVADDRLRIGFDANETVGLEALTVPIFPEHVWGELVEELDDDRATTQGWLWDELRSDDVDRIGSGPYEFADRTERDRLTLERFDDHFTLQEGVDLPAPTVEELQVLVDPGSASAVEQVASGRADVTFSALESHVVDQAEDVTEATLVENEPTSFYHVGFNCRTAPFSNPRFRGVVARLLDPQVLIDDHFNGHATPITVPVDDRWIPEELSWQEGDPVDPFFGEDGEFDEEAARDAFRDAGFRYEDGRLVVNN